MSNVITAVILLAVMFVPMAADAQTWCTVGGKISVPCPLTGQGPAGQGQQATFGSIILFIINTALLIVGSVAVLALIWGGFQYITAFGNEEQAESAKKIVTYSVLGLGIVILSFAIITLITNFLIRGIV